MNLKVTRAIHSEILSTKQSKTTTTKNKLQQTKQIRGGGIGEEELFQNGLSVKGQSEICKCQLSCSSSKNFSSSDTR